MIGRFRIWLAGVALSIAAVLGAYLRGRSDAAQRGKLEEAQGYAETRKRIDAVEPMPDASSAREWLRERGQR